MIFFLHPIQFTLSLDGEPLLPHLMDTIATVIPHKFETVGIQLGFTLGELQVIGPHLPTIEDHQSAFREMFCVWRKRRSPPFTCVVTRLKYQFLICQNPMRQHLNTSMRMRVA